MSEMLVAKNNNCGSDTATTQCSVALAQAFKANEAQQVMMPQLLDDAAKFMSKHKETVAGVVLEVNQMNFIIDPSAQSNVTREDIVAKLPPACQDVVNEIPGTNLLGFQCTTKRIQILSKKEDEHTVRYDIDPSYKSPVGHIWDDKGSRDL